MDRQNKDLDSRSDIVLALGKLLLPLVAALLNPW